MKKLINSCVCVTRLMAVSDAGVYRFGPAKFLILTILPQGTGPVHALLQKTHRYRFWETYIPRPEIT